MYVYDLSVFSLAEELSDRVHQQSLRVTNITESELAVNRTATALADLLDYIEKSVMNSEATEKKVKALKSVLRRIKV